MSEKRRLRSICLDFDGLEELRAVADGLGGVDFRRRNTLTGADRRANVDYLSPFWAKIVGELAARPFEEPEP